MRRELHGFWLGDAERSLVTYFRYSGIMTHKMIQCHWIASASGNEWVMHQRRLWPDGNRLSIEGHEVVMKPRADPLPALLDERTPLADDNYEFDDDSSYDAQSSGSTFCVVVQRGDGSVIELPHPMSDSRLEQLIVGSFPWLA